MTAKDTEIACSYDTLTSILKYSEYNQRERLIGKCATLKTIEARNKFPYSFDTVEIKTDSFKLTDRGTASEWSFCRSTRSKTEIEFRSAQKHFYKTLEKPGIESFNELLEEYLRPGTRIGMLRLDFTTTNGMPIDPTEIKTENLRLKVKNLEIESFTAEVFHKWIATIDISNGNCLDSIPLFGRAWRASRDSVDIITMLQHPAIQSAQKVILNEKLIRMSRDKWLFNLPNKHIELVTRVYTFDTLGLLPQEWIENHRPLGYTFTQRMQYSNSFQKFCEYMEETTGAIPSTFASAEREKQECFTFPMDDELELVLYEEIRGVVNPKPKPQQVINRPVQPINLMPENPAFAKFEVMKKGSTVPRKESAD